MTKKMEVECGLIRQNLLSLGVQYNWEWSLRLTRVSWRHFPLRFDFDCAGMPRFSYNDTTIQLYHRE